MGVVLGAREVDRLEIWLNQRLTPLSVSRFNWALYASDDNLNWALVNSFEYLGYTLRQRGR